jgi:hypothetical protein
MREGLLKIAPGFIYLGEELMACKDQGFGIVYGDR